VFLFLVIKNKMKAKYLILTVIIIFLFFPLLYRLLQSGLSLDRDLYFRKIVLTRLDTIGFGILGAYLYNYCYNFWTKYKYIFFISGLSLLIIFISVDFKNVFFYETFYFSFIGFFIFLLLPMLESLKKETLPFKPFQFISKISYSMYLVHWPLLQIISKVWVQTNKTEAILIYSFYWVMTLSISGLIYKYYERPLMNIRDSRLFLHNK
jgi:peptidoglycan/LPS O-acetylase OafA/YrhL